MLVQLSSQWNCEEIAILIVIYCLVIEPLSSFCLVLESHWSLNKLYNVLQMIDDVAITISSAKKVKEAATASSLEAFFHIEAKYFQNTL